LVLGDGIREDVEGISYLFQQNALQSFTFGLIETGLYRFPDGRLLLQPRLLTRTSIIERSVIEISAQGTAAVAVAMPESSEASEANDEGAPASSDAIREDRAYWDQFLAQLVLDDPEQVPPTRRGFGNARMPLPLPNTWITVYRAKSTQEIGVFLRAKGDQAITVAQLLAPHRATIVALLPEDTLWTEDPQSLTIAASMKTAALSSEQACDRDQEYRWLADTLNRLVNAVRPLLTSP